jgi:uncharacterized protein YkwD
MLRWSKQLVILAALVSATVVPLRAIGAPAAPSVSLSSLEAGVLAQINGFRSSQGLAALQVSPALTLAARSHSESMATHGYFSHDSADGSQFWQRLRHFYPPARGHSWAVGENLLWSSPDIDAPGALQLWLGSPPHREILMDPRWRQIGLSAVHVASAPGTFGGSEVTVVTADFGVRR